MPKKPANDASYGAKAAADRIGVDVRILKREAAAGRVPAFRIGNDWRFPRAFYDALANGERWLDSTTGRTAVLSAEMLSLHNSEGEGASDG